MTRARLAAIHLALAGMLLRALLPTGWMPGPGGQPGSALVICSMGGGAAPTGDHGSLPSKRQPDGRSDHDGCPFATAPHLATGGSLPFVHQSQVAQI